MSDLFYKELENRFRGNRELILARLEVYRDIIKDLATDKELRCVDVGCGRGEWLEFLKQYTGDCVGLDLDQGMVDCCIQLGLRSIRVDGVEYLKTQQSSSLDIISAFHVVEHIDIDHLELLLTEAYRVLNESGVLIIETPNPENIYAMNLYFHLDPTHKKPIPHQLLSFLLERAGFKSQKLFRLNQFRISTRDYKVDGCDLISSVGPDYSIVSKKTIKTLDVESESPVLQEVVGLSSREFANKFNEDLNRFLDEVASQHIKIDLQLVDLINRIEEIASKVEELDNTFLKRLKKYLMR